MKSSLILLFLCISYPAYSATIVADSASREEVLESVNNATSGDTVLIPATTGPVAWLSGITIPDDKRLIIKGAGPTKTIISKDADWSVFNLGLSGSRVTQIGFIQIQCGQERLPGSSFTSTRKQRHPQLGNL